MSQEVIALLMLIATVIYVLYTGNLVKETMKMREVATNPFINAKLILEQGFSKIVIENIGKSPAYNLQIEFEEEVLKEIKPNNCYKTYSSNISYFGVGQHLDINFNTQVFIQLEKDIILNIKYYSVNKKYFRETIKLNFGAEKDFGSFYPKNKYEDQFDKIISELNKIGANIKK